MADKDECAAATGTQCGHEATAEDRVRQLATTLLGMAIGTQFDLGRTYDEIMALCEDLARRIDGLKANGRIRDAHDRFQSEIVASQGKA